MCVGGGHFEAVYSRAAGGPASYSNLLDILTYTRGLGPATELSSPAQLLHFSGVSPISQHAPCCRAAPSGCTLASEGQAWPLARHHDRCPHGWGRLELLWRTARLSPSGFVDPSPRREKGGRWGARQPHMGGGRACFRGTDASRSTPKYLAVPRMEHCPLSFKRMRPEKYEAR